MFKNRHQSPFEVFPGADDVRSSLALEVVASIVLVWIGLWTLLWLFLPGRGVETGSWLGFFGSPVAMAIFAAMAVPLGSFLCLFGIPRAGTDLIRLRPIWGVKMGIALYRFVRSGFRPRR